MCRVLAAVFDGHGGTLSSDWLRDNLLSYIAPRVDESLLTAADDDPAASSPPPPSGSGRSGSGSDDDAGGDEARWRAAALAAELIPGVRWPRRAREAMTAAFKEADAELIRHLKSECVIV